MLDWVKNRLKERTSYDGAALIAVGLVVLFLGPFASYAAWAAVAWGAWTLFNKQGCESWLNQPRLKTRFWEPRLKEQCSENNV